jgi:hypothetical protein
MEEYCCFRYVTYSKEEEAIRCIQNVHVVLEGRPLRYQYLHLLRPFTTYGMIGIWFLLISSFYYVWDVIGLYISGLVLEQLNIVMHGSNMV